MGLAHLAQFQTRLEQEQARLERELALIATPDPTLRDDWDATFPRPASASATMSHSALEEQADLREEYETVLAQEQTLEVRLREVKRALGRIAAGSFGRCAQCGEPISEARLEANPAAEYDMEHQPRE